MANPASRLAGLRHLPLARWQGLSDRGRNILVHLGLAAITYLPLTLTARGRVAADIKQYLYVDPSKLLAKAPYLWDATTGMGTVTHQTVGYLWPAGPWYWALDKLGVPDWLAQRLWLATILFAAGAGVLFLLRTLRWPATGAGTVIAAFAYMLSPYSLDYAARISSLLLPWAALPWMIALVIRGLRRGGWRHPALFALLVTTASGLNATAVLFAGLGPLLWLPFAVWVQKEATWRRAVGVALRIGALTLATQLWWVLALAMQGRYGLPILTYTETIETVSNASLASEILRGLGYWLFYGTDALGPWIEPSVDYTQHLWLLAAGFAIPVLGFAGALVTRFRHRAFFVTIVVVGLTVAVGAHPYGSPSPIGRLFKDFATTSTAGLALRSTARAAPLVSLGVCVLLGAGLIGLRQRVPRLAVSAAAVLAIVVVVNLPPLWKGTFIGRNLQRPEEVPSWWSEAAGALDAEGDATRVLEVPGSDFAVYRWGNTVDAVTPGLMDRPWVVRELIPYGSEESADLLNAFDRQFQEGLLEPGMLAPLARLMAAGDVLVRNDMAYERYNTARPRSIQQLLSPLPDGLGQPQPFGPVYENRAGPQLPLIDAMELGQLLGTPYPHAIEVFPVTDPEPIVRAKSPANTVVLAGDGEGVVAAAAAGVLDGHELLLYSAALLDDETVDRALADGARLVLTDSNRKRARRWATVRENAGFTEQADEEPLVEDPSDARLPVFPEAPVSAFTVVDLQGVDQVRATAYGNPVSYVAEDRAALAVDGDLDTAWRVGAFSDIRGERLRIDLEEPTYIGDLTLVQPLTGPRHRFLTRVEVRFDVGEPINVDLGESSRTTAGQLVHVDRTVSRIEIELGDTNIGVRATYPGQNGVGFAEVGIPGVRADEVVVLPHDLLQAAGTASLDHSLTVVMSRQRANPAVSVRQDEERSLQRSFRLPTDRRFTLTGSARIAATIPDDLIDHLLGLPSAGDGGLTAISSSRIAGSLTARASAALDGDPTTAWMPDVGAEGGFVQATLPAPVRFDHLDLQVRADGRHSVPTVVRIETGGQTRRVELPAIADHPDENHVTTVPVTFEAIEGDVVRVTVEAVRLVQSTEYYSGLPLTLPVGVAELGIPGIERSTLPTELPDTCRLDLLFVDGRPLPIRLLGTPEVAERRQAVDFVPCTDESAIALDEGGHLLSTALGHRIGIDVDRIVLDSAAGGGPGPARPQAGPAVPRPSVSVDEASRISFDLTVQSDGKPMWLILGQSHNDGWEATVDGEALGSPELVDGYANGWYLDLPAGEASVSLRWQPQRTVWGGMVISALAVLSCLAVLVVTARRRLTGDWLTPSLPVLVNPLTSDGHPPSRRRALVIAVTLGLVFLVVGGPWAGGAVLVGALVALLARRGRLATVGGSVAALSAAALVTIGLQFGHEYPASFEWPSLFDTAHTLAWVAVGLLATDVIVDLAWRGRRFEIPPSPDDPPPLTSS